MIMCIPFISVTGSAEIYNMGNFAIGSETFLFADKVNVRKIP
jgi:hypothetical protein